MCEHICISPEMKVNCSIKAKDIMIHLIIAIFYTGLYSEPTTII